MDSDQDGYTVDVDCDDGNATIYPNAAELCDSRDNDCDGEIDEGLIADYYYDADKDGFGDPSSAFHACTRPVGYVAQGGDCNDADATIHPGAAEVCDKIDNDCDGEVDEAVTATYYLDQDHDGYGVSSSSTQACSLPAGYSASSGDCNDADATTSPGASERCDGRDNDCNGIADDGATATYYLDSDGDGYGGTQSTVSSCVPPSGYSSKGGDCADSNPAINPGVSESCDGKDNNCSGAIDEGVTSIYYLDQDKDGYGVAGMSIVACSAPVGYSSTAGDCNDANMSINPGALEVCDGVDNNCNGKADDGATALWYLDSDGDGYGSNAVTVYACPAPQGYTAQGGDCNDSDARMNPGAREVCDTVDNDCDGAVDEGFVTAYYRDKDADSFGDPAVLVQACAKPSGYVTDKTDCNDNDKAINPSAQEVCDSKDNDCDSLVDDGLQFSSYYRDQDGDLYGNSSVNQQACSKPSGYVTLSGDCNDTNAAIYPGAPELCDALDNDCDTQIDDGLTLTSYYRDQDGDLFGSTSSALQSCTKPTGYITQSGDCNDSNSRVYPGAPELCDALDNDCDGSSDEQLNVAYYEDKDLDGFGSDSTQIQGNCEKPAGYVSQRGDCNENDAAYHPGAPDAYNDGKDQDCGGTGNSDPHVGLSSTSKSTLAAALAAVTTDHQIIWVGPGTYLEYDLRFPYFDISLMSTGREVATVVDARSLGRGFIFDRGETAWATLDGFTITRGYSGNATAGGGGCIFINGSSPTVSGGVFSHCSTPSSGNGGGLLVVGGAPNLMSLVVSDCSAAYGGGIALESSTTSRLQYCTFIGNHASRNGGGVNVYKSSPSIEHATIRQNTGQSGAGMSLYQSLAKLSRVTAEDNTATDYGGGLMLTSSSSATLSNLRVTGNSASYGGGVSLFTQSIPTITNALIEGNYALQSGGGLHIDSAGMNLKNGTVLNNTSGAYEGGGIYINLSVDVTIKNSILAYNSGYNLYLTGSGSTLSTLTHSDLYSAPGGYNHNLSWLDSTNVVTEPGFLEYANGMPSQYHLATSSSLVNKGESTGKDLDGSRIDLGMYGGDMGGSWDVDFDTSPDYFWPGYFSNAPAGTNTSIYECYDLDGSRQGC